MLKGTLRQEGREEPATPERVLEALSGSAFFWLDLDDIDGDGTVSELLGVHFGFHPLAVSAAERFSQRPRIDEYGDFIYLVARGADRVAVHRIALHSLAHECPRKLRATFRAAFRNTGGMKSERLEHPLLHELRDWGGEPTLKCQLQQHVTGVAIGVLFARLLSFTRRPSVEHAQKVGQAVTVIRPGRMVGGQQQSRSVARQLPQCHAANVLSLPQLGDVIGNSIGERKLAYIDGLCQQRSFEYLAYRSNVEQRVRCNRPRADSANCPLPREIRS